MRITDQDRVRNMRNPLNRKSPSTPGITNLLVVLILTFIQIAVPYQVFAASSSQLAQTPEPNPTATADQTEEPTDQASLLLEQMTPEERVGQLFLIFLLCLHRLFFLRVHRIERLATGELTFVKIPIRQVIEYLQMHEI